MLTIDQDPISVLIVVEKRKVENLDSHNRLGCCLWRLRLDKGLKAKECHQTQESSAHSSVEFLHGFSRFKRDPNYFSYCTCGFSPHVIALVLSENVL